MSLFSMLKHNSKLALRGNRGKAILALLISILAYILVAALENAALFMFDTTPNNFEQFTSYIDVFTAAFAFSTLEMLLIGGSSVLLFFVASPIYLGVVRWFYNLVHGYTSSVGEVFHFFETPRRYFRSLWLYFSLSVRSYLWAIVFFALPSAMLAVCVLILSGKLTELSREVSTYATTGLFLALALFTLAGIFYLVLLNRYRLAPYLLQEQPEMSVGKAIKMSIAYTKGYRFSFFLFDMSFLGWAILSIIFLPIALYVYPYMCTSFAMYARYIIEKNRFIPDNATKEFNAPHQI